jgi:hypothetical protein
MTAIWFVTVYHLLLGITMLALPSFPRPFGQIEPFLAHFSVEQTGVMFLSVSALSTIGLLIGFVWYLPNPWWRLARRCFFLLPQQFLITWGAMSSLTAVINSPDPWGDPTNARAIAVLCFLIPATILHLVGATQWYLSRPRWLSPQCRPCPFYKAIQKLIQRANGHAPGR